MKGERKAQASLRWQQDQHGDYGIIFGACAEYTAKVVDRYDDPHFEIWQDGTDGFADYRHVSDRLGTQGVDIFTEATQLLIGWLLNPAPAPTVKHRGAW